MEQCRAWMKDLVGLRQGMRLRGEDDQELWRWWVQEDVLIMDGSKLTRLLMSLLDRG